MVRPISHMKTGTRGSVTSISSADSGSIAATSNSTAAGTTAASTSCGSRAREHRLEGVDAGHRRHSQLGIVLCIEAGGGVAQPAPDQVAAKRAQHVGRGQPADHVESPGGRRPRGHHDAQRRQRDGQRPRPGAVERARGDVGDQHRLGQHQQRRDDPERGVDRQREA